MEKLIISAAITGSLITREQSPYIPITPEEIAWSGIDAWKAGASILHIHVRDPETGLGTQDPTLFKKVVNLVRNESNAILCLTTSGIPGRNLPVTERLHPVELYPELVSFDAGSINLGGNVLVNSPEFLETLASETLKRGIKPELGVFEVGMVYTCIRLMENGLVKPPLLFQFALGTQGGIPATPKSLMYLVEVIPPLSTWSVVEKGTGILPMAMMANVMGGHVRIGLEDNIYYSPGVLAKSNAQLVERVARLSEHYGREVATSDEARRILGLDCLSTKSSDA